MGKGGGGRDLDVAVPAEDKAVCSGREQLKLRVQPLTHASEPLHPRNLSLIQFTCAQCIPTRTSALHPLVGQGRRLKEAKSVAVPSSTAVQQN